MRRLSKPTSIPSRPSFVAFDLPDPQLHPIYRRNLPHLRLDGATYFVTFRLADSIPETVASQWRAISNRWLRKHGVDPAWEQSDPSRWRVAYASIPADHRRAFEHATHRRFFAELDKSHGSCVLRDAHAMVASAIEFFHTQRAWIGDYVVMPNHVHAVIQPFPGVKLQDWLYSVKRFTGTRMPTSTSDHPAAGSGRRQVWQPESFDRLIRDRAELARTRRYIAQNPAKLKVGTYTLKQMDWLDEFAARS